MTGHKRLKTKVRSRKVFAKCVPLSHGKPAKKADKPAKTQKKKKRTALPPPAETIHRSRRKNSSPPFPDWRHTDHREKWTPTKKQKSKRRILRKGPERKKQKREKQKVKWPKKTTNKKSVDALNLQDIPVKNSKIHTPDIGKNAKHQWYLRGHVMEGGEGKRTNTDIPKPNLNLRAIKASKTVCV